MKILVTNLDVGSGIEYVGDKIICWLKETPHEIIEFKYQTCVGLFLDYLLETNPDIVIINEYFPRIIEPLYYYKRFRPKTKILFIPHSWTYLIDKPLDENTHLQDRMIHLFSRISDKILLLSRNHTNLKYLYGVEEKLKELYMPVSSEEYKIITPWKNRTKNFCYIGQLSPLRISNEFLEKIKTTDLIIDCYGEDSMNRLLNHKNLINRPRIEQKDMTMALNEYKYFVVPHDGQEVFFIALLQAIMCGTIPLVVNNRNAVDYNYTWIDWANDLYFGTYNVDPFIENLKLLTKDDKDLTPISEHISSIARATFDEKAIKEEILNFVTNCGII